MWIEDFLRFCAQRGLPVDFVSTHPYPTDFALDEKGVCRGRSRGVQSTFDDLRWIRRTVDSSPFPEAEIHLTEWSSSPSARDFTHDYPQAAAYIVRTNLDSLGLVDSLSYWTFTDVFEEGAGGPTIFHGGFGLINFQGIVKPACHAYRLLANLGNELLAQGRGWAATRDAVDGRIAILVTHYPDEVKEAVPMCSTRQEADAYLEKGNPDDTSIVAKGLAPGAVFEVETLDPEHGWAMRAWQEMGEPEPPTREQADYLQQAAMATAPSVVRADAHGVLTVKRRLAPWGVLSLRQMGCD